MPKQAIILAAGGGGRTRPFTANRSKSMLNIGGKPMVQYVIEALNRNGIRDIIVVVGHRKERIFDFLGSGDRLGVHITYVVQEHQLGSADALFQAQKYAAEEFLVLPGNKYLRAETLLSIVDAAAPAMLVKKITDPPRSSMVSIRDGKIDNDSWAERRTIKTPFEKGIFTVDTRVYALNNQIFSFLETAPSITMALRHMMDTGLQVSCVETDREWADLIYPWDILGVSESALKHTQPNTAGSVSSNVALRGKVNIGESCVINPFINISGPVVIGQGCTLGPHVSICGPVSIGAHTVIEQFTSISNSVIGSNVLIGSGAIIEDSVIDDGTVIGARFTSVNGETDINIEGEYHHTKIGAMIGEGCRLGAGIITKPGTIIGNFCQVADLKVLSGQIPDRSMVI